MPNAETPAVYFSAACGDSQEFMCARLTLGSITGQPIGLLVITLHDTIDSHIIKSQVALGCLVGSHSVHFCKHQRTIRVPLPAIFDQRPTLLPKAP